MILTNPSDASVETRRRVRDIVGSVWPLLRELTSARIGILAGVAVLVLLSRGASLVPAASLKYLVDDVLLRNKVGLLAPLALGMVTAALVQAAASYFAGVRLSQEGLQLVTRLQRKAHAHVAGLPVSFHDSTSSGALARRIVSDADSVRNLIGLHLIEFVGAIVTGFAALVFLFMISPRLASIALLCIVVSGAVAKKSFHHVHALFRERMRVAAEVTGRLVESIAGVRVVKAYRAEQHESRRFSDGVDAMYRASLRAVYATSLSDVTITSVRSLVATVIVYLAALEILQARMTIGELVTFTALLPFVMAPVLQLPGISTVFAENLAGLEQLQQLLRRPSEDSNPKRTIDIGPIEGTIGFYGVSFAYDKRPPTLTDITFEIRPGTATALVGPSGAGKSTIIGLVSAFYEPSAGVIRIDNHDLAALTLESYRKQLGVVLQETFLFDGTIRENVAFARAGASERSIIEACRIAHVQEFAERLPERYNTIVGERGVKLSMGQRQRIAIARAVLADPRILILDEATSSLDSESEAAIRDGLAYLMKGRTTLLIAHRLSTIEMSDQILVIEHGRLVERGTHESLWNARGRYYALALQQREAQRAMAPP